MGDQGVGGGGFHGLLGLFSLSFLGLRLLLLLQSEGIGVESHIPSFGRLVARGRGRGLPVEESGYGLGGGLRGGDGLFAEGVKAVEYGLLSSLGLEQGGRVGVDLWVGIELGLRFGLAVLRDSCNIVQPALLEFSLVLQEVVKLAGSFARLEDLRRKCALLHVARVQLLLHQFFLPLHIVRVLIHTLAEVAGTFMFLMGDRSWKEAYPALGLDVLDIALGDEDLACVLILVLFLGQSFSQLLDSTHPDHVICLLEVVLVLWVCGVFLRLLLSRRQRLACRCSFLHSFCGLSLQSPRLLLFFRSQQLLN